ncbi:unnamed protein product [Parnassius apollo]|uniref:(apollo) hypothetical protein n=1 Tax=Parnassius apollo TaxID=110799 RepID=A0A8S3YCW8_PARAO|nr:unnamed protein product [Parnassius apollo]
MPSIMLDEKLITPEIVSSWLCPIYENNVPNENKNDYNTPARNVLLKRGNKRIAPNSPPKIELDTNVTRGDVRGIIQEAMETNFDSLVTKFNSMLVSALNFKLSPIEKEIAEIKTSMSFNFMKNVKGAGENKKQINEIQKEN